MTPRPQLSLCVPICADVGQLQDFHENLSKFFQKFPIFYEVLFALNPGQDQSLSLLQSFVERYPHYRIMENKKSSSRAKNLQMLFAKSSGDILVATDLDLAAPLSEIFKMLEVFFSDQSTEVIFGNRFKAKKNLENQKAKESVLEKFFMGVLKEKTPWRFADPFCPTLGLRRTSFEKIENDLKSCGWHWTQEVQRVIQIKGLKAQEIPLYIGSRRGLRPPRSEALHLLNFVLFRI